MSPAAAAVMAVLGCASLAFLGKGLFLFGTFARAARAGAMVALAGGAVALLWAAFLSYSGRAYAWFGLAVLCVALTGAVYSTGERKPSRAVGVALVAAVVVAVVFWTSFAIWLAAGYRD